MTGKKILKLSPYIIVVILEILTWFLDSETLKYTVNHLIVFVLIYIGYQIISINENSKRLIDNLQDTITLLSKKDFKNSNLLSLISYGYSKFNPKDFPKIWADLMWNAKNEFHSSNYIHPEHLWGTKFSRAALLIQQAKIANDGVSMSRLFIYEKDEELNQLEDPMQANFDAEIDVYYISIQKIMTISHLKSCIKSETENSIDTLAFNLVDNVSVLLYELNDKREIKSFKLVVDEKVYEKYKDFYVNVIKSATKYKSKSS